MCGKFACGQVISPEKSSLLFISPLGNLDIYSFSFADEFFVLVFRYDSPLPTLPPGLAIISDEDIQNSPLPPIPPSYEDAMSDEDEAKPRTSGSTNSAAGESGIDVDGEDNGCDYTDDSRVDSPFLPREGNKPVAIEMSGAAEVPEAEVLIKGQRRKIETEL